MSSDEIDIEVEDEIDDEIVSVNYDIASYPSDLTLAGLAQMWRDKDIQIPDYQREFVWTVKQSSLLIDSFLCNLPVPNVFFYVDEDNRNIVIDGQQRILSVVFFLEGYFGKETASGKRQVFRLSGLNKKSPYYNKRFIDLTESDQRKLKQSVLRAINIKQLNPIGESTSAYHIFERLNTGGTPLKPQEIRNCVFIGGLSKILRDLNKDSNWRSIIGKKDVDKHQKDVELILRVFSLVGNGWQSYEKPMSEFLNKAMKEHRSGETKRVETFFKAFPLAAKKVIDDLGDKPFRVRGPINVAALESVMCVLTYNYKKLASINLKKSYTSLLKSDEFDELTRVNTTDVKTVQERIRLVNKVLMGK